MNVRVSPLDFAKVANAFAAAIPVVPLGLKHRLGRARRLAWPLQVKGNARPAPRLHRDQAAKHDDAPAGTVEGVTCGKRKPVVADAVGDVSVRGGKDDPLLLGAIEQAGIWRLDDDRVALS